MCFYESCHLLRSIDYVVEHIGRQVAYFCAFTADGFDVGVFFWGYYRRYVACYQMTSVAYDAGFSTTRFVSGYWDLMLVCSGVIRAIFLSHFIS